MKNIITQELEAHATAFIKFVSNEDNLTDIEVAALMCIDALRDRGKLITCGNGGSMSDAMHFASELSGKYRGVRPAIAALALSDQGALSCIANDFGYTQVFKRQIEAIGRTGDVLVCLSTSGNSQNIIVAAEAAKRLGLKVIGIGGNGGGNLREFCDAWIDIPYSGYADRTQEISIVVIHILVGLIEKNLCAHP